MTDARAGLEAYLVGGAVRDQLLHLPIKERDYVVVGATPEEMVARGFKPVGRDFPVFLHPVTHEEYALARTERKTGRGYLGFTCYTSPDISLTEDLMRRDLTVNAMALDERGQLIDPYGGYQDLQQRILRHVSPAFVEDPVRILRLARFAARFPGFTVATDTMQLVHKMVASGEIADLVAERVLQEFWKALAASYPSRFFEVLYAAGALAILFPELQIHYPAVLQVTQQPAFIQTSQPLVRFSAISSLLNLEQLRTWHQRLHFARQHYLLGQLSIRLHERLIGQVILRLPDADLTLLKELDAFRRLELMELAICGLKLTSATKVRQMQLISLHAVLGRVVLVKLTPLEIQQERDKRRLKDKLYYKRQRWLWNSLLNFITC